MKFKIQHVKQKPRLLNNSEKPDYNPAMNTRLRMVILKGHTRKHW